MQAPVTGQHLPLQRIYSGKKQLQYRAEKRGFLCLRKRQPVPNGMVFDILCVYLDSYMDAQHGLTLKTLTK